jgi:peptide/nickel transport system permease protein
MITRLAWCILAAWALLALFAPMLPLAPNTIRLEHLLDAPSLQAVFGYDDLGRDIGARLLTGARTSFLVAVWVVTLSLCTGTLIGAFSAWRGSWWDRVATQLVDIFLAFPGILLAIALAGLLGPGVDNVVIALTVVGWVGYARLARAQVLTLKQREHVQAARVLGSSEWFILRRHLLPLMTSALIVEATFGIASVVVAEAGLSFLGLGVQPPVASWGAMIRDGSRYLLVAPHMVLAPGLSMVAVVLAVNLLGDRLRDRLDTRLGNATGGDE